MPTPPAGSESTLRVPECDTPHPQACASSCTPSALVDSCPCGIFGICTKPPPIVLFPLGFLSVPLYSILSQQLKTTPKVVTLECQVSLINVFLPEKHLVTRTWLITVTSQRKATVKRVFRAHSLGWQGWLGKSASLGAQHEPGSWPQERGPILCCGPHLPGTPQPQHSVLLCGEEIWHLSQLLKKRKILPT